MKLRRRGSDYLENPDTQIRFHKRMMSFWIVAAMFMNVVWLASFFVDSRMVLFIASFISIVTNQISFYANWDTDFGALSAAQSTRETLAQRPKSVL